MGRAEDLAIREIRQVRAKIARRLAKAMQAGRFLEELRAIGLEGRRAYHKVAGGARNGHKQAK